MTAQSGPNTHDGEVIGDFLTGRHKASCSCGWEARQDRGMASEAWDDWSNHCDVVFMEATGG